MNRKQVTDQIAELTAENEELNGMLNDPTYGDTNKEIIADNLVAIELLQYVAANATDEDIRIAQLALPGRASLMRWAKKQMGR